MSNLGYFKKKIALMLAYASVFGGKTLAMNTSKNEAKSSQSLGAASNKLANPKILKKSKSMSNLTRNLIIGGSIVLTGGAIVGGIKLAGYLNNKEQKSVPLEGSKAEEAKKLMSNFLSQNWVIDKSSGCFCRVAGHIDDLVKFPNNLNFDLFEKKENKAPKGLDQWASYHINKIREVFNENKNTAKFFKANGDTEDTKKFEYLIFSFNGQIIKISTIKNTKQLHDLEFLAYNTDNNKCNCCWKFLLNSAK